MALKAPRGFSGTFREDDEARALYSEAAGIARVMPAAVAVPRDVDDARTLVRWAAEIGLTLVPRGSGSSMAGGAVGPGIVVDLSRLRAIGEPDRERRCMRASVGVLRGEIQRRAASVGLRFPVDPSSGEFCTIGGMVATNAAGAHSLLHGPMRPWVLAIDCVFDDGSAATVRRGEPPPDVPAVNRFLGAVASEIVASGFPARRVVKDASGYGIAQYAQTRDLVDVLVGSEGTLALLTAVDVALIPAAEASASLLVAFDTLDAAVTAAILARESGVAACELLDRTFLAIAARSGHPLPVPSNAEAVLMIEIEASDASDATERAHSISRSLRDQGADVAIVAVDRARELELWAFRHAASPALSSLDPTLRSMQFIEDGAVPPECLASYVRGVRDILDRHDTTGVIFGHAGDAHVHVNPLVDVSRSDWRQRVERILVDTTDLIARLGGTLSGEHGDGRLRAPLLPHVRSPRELNLYQAVKRAFDPRGVFNPGVKIALDGQRAIDGVKYDPDLPLHPERARMALDLVERDRAYSRLRLDLL